MICSQKCNFYEQTQKNNMIIIYIGSFAATDGLFRRCSSCGINRYRKKSIFSCQIRYEPQRVVISEQQIQPFITKSWVINLCGLLHLKTLDLIDNLEPLGSTWFFSDTKKTVFCLHVIVQLRTQGFSRGQRSTSHWAFIDFFPTKTSRANQLG